MTEKRENKPNDSSQEEQINVSPEFREDGTNKFDKEKFYAYLKLKKKGKNNQDFGSIGIDEFVEYMVLKDNAKDRWNYKMEML